MTLLTAIIAIAIIATAYAIHKTLQFFIVGYYQYAIGLVEDYLATLEGGVVDEELNREYDAFLRSWNPFKRFMVGVHDMREIRRGEYDFGDYDK